MKYKKSKSSKLKNTSLVAIKTEKDSLTKEENNNTSGIVYKNEKTKLYYYLN